MYLLTFNDTSQSLNAELSHKEILLIINGRLLISLGAQICGVAWKNPSFGEILERYRKLWVFAELKHILFAHTVSQSQGKF